MKVSLQIQTDVMTDNVNQSNLRPERDKASADQGHQNNHKSLGRICMRCDEMEIRLGLQQECRHHEHVKVASEADRLLSKV